MTTEQQLIATIGKAAQEYYPKYKILPSLTIAQAILESGWGRSYLSKRANNYFGMKAGRYWTGATYNADTGEQTVSGKTFMINADFRSYSSISQGIKGYYEFLNYDRYANLKGVTDYKTACLLIKQDGWATDIHYTDKLISLIENNGLAKFDSVAKIEEVEEVKEIRYATVAELPPWAQKTVQNLMNKGYIADTDNLDLSLDMVRILVINDRSNMYK